MIETKPLLKIGIHRKYWEIKDKDPDGFKREVRAYTALCYPKWEVVKAKYPHVYLKEGTKWVDG